VQPGSSVSSLTWQSQPAVILAWGFLAFIIAGYALGIDRTFLIDQPNYLENFAAAPRLDWLHGLTENDAGIRGLIVAVFSEEILWQVWATALGLAFTPAVAVILTVCTLNLLMVLAVVRLANPALPLVIWILVPVGFAVTGLLQLRQGFAFAVMLYLALRMNRPLLGTLLAAMIHTTFGLALTFAAIAWLCGRRQLVALVLAVAMAGAAAYLGGVLFELLGGRRLAIYDVNQAETNSILYVFGGLLCSLPSLHRLLIGPARDEAPAASRTLATLAVIHVAVIAFTAVSFFVFPLGAGRIGYLTMLLLIPILPTMRRHDSVTGAMVFGLLLVYLVYLTVKTYLEGTYDILLGS
jgi:EpsG-like putative glucosyltransferase